MLKGHQDQSIEKAVLPFNTAMEPTEVHLLYSCTGIEFNSQVSTVASSSLIIIPKSKYDTSLPKRRVKSEIQLQKRRLKLMWPS